LFTKRRKASRITDEPVSTHERIAPEDFVLDQTTSRTTQTIVRTSAGPAGQTHNSAVPREPPDVINQLPESSTIPVPVTLTTLGAPEVAATEFEDEVPHEKSAGRCGPSSAIEIHSQASPKKRAEKRLSDAASKLRAAMGQKPDEFQYKQPVCIADVDCIAEKLWALIVQSIDAREDLKASQSHVKVFVETWVKRSLPIVKTSLAVAKVCIP
jgi:hypothetical protein